MLGLDFNELLQIWLVEVLTGVGQDVLGLFLQHLEQEDGDHILQFGMLPQVSLVIHAILHFLLIQ